MNMHEFFCQFFLARFIYAHPCGAHFIFAFFLGFLSLAGARWSAYLPPDDGHSRRKLVCGINFLGFRQEAFVFSETVKVNQRYLKAKELVSF
jgi:hypothetical protein